MVARLAVAVSVNQEEGTLSVIIYHFGVEGRYGQLADTLVFSHGCVMMLYEKLRKNLGRLDEILQERRKPYASAVPQKEREHRDS